MVTGVRKFNTHQPGKEQGCRLALSPPGKGQRGVAVYVWGHLCKEPAIPVPCSNEYVMIFTADNFLPTIK